MGSGWELKLGRKRSRRREKEGKEVGRREEEYRDRKAKGKEEGSIRRGEKEGERGIRGEEETMERKGIIMDQKRK